jgi:hypothetical protein
MQRLDTAKIATRCAPAAFDVAKAAQKLRYACGYAPTNKSDPWLARASLDLRHRRLHTALAPKRFKDFWRE